MILFNDLHITPDKKYLVIDVLIKEGSWYSNVYLDTIVIDTLKTFSETGPSNTPIATLNCNHVKYYRKFIDIDTISDNMFFVYVKADESEGTVSEEAPCSCKGANFLLGVAYDKLSLYLKGIKQFNQVQGCEISKDLLDYILVSKAFDINLKVGNYSKAIEYWKKLLSIPSNTVNSKCNCYGTI